MLPLRDEEIVGRISYDQHVSIQAAAYAVYAELTPNNKKPISQREFHRIFKDHWRAFDALETEEYDED
jgi:hypothetical protein